MGTDKEKLEELQKKVQENRDKCRAEIGEVLKKYNMQLAVDPNSPISNPLIILI